MKEELKYVPEYLQFDDITRDILNKIVESGVNGIRYSQLIKTCKIKNKNGNKISLQDEQLRRRLKILEGNNLIISKDKKYFNVQGFSFLNIKSFCKSSIDDYIEDISLFNNLIFFGLKQEELNSSPEIKEHIKKIIEEILEIEQIRLKKEGKKLYSLFILELRRIKDRRCKIFIKRIMPEIITEILFSRRVLESISTRNEEQINKNTLIFEFNKFISDLSSHSHYFNKIYTFNNSSKIIIYGFVLRLFIKFKICPLSFFFKLKMPFEFDRTPNNKLLKELKFIDKNNHKFNLTSS